ncbi:unnamed protein product [Cuscuta campestris]|uniref:Chromo domain-containing protein n=1 Tax=Cuscuta campestris TaxID=132261 RepID=A0A484LCU2_9ASTE|nr:unnamed protein product [Cuscuta campestris]
MENRFAGIDERINAQDLKLDQIMMILKKMETHSGKEKESNTTSVGDRIQSNGRLLNFNPKLEFPRFDGSNTRNWIKKAGKYFNLCKIPEEQWVDIASLYMIDKAENWMSSYLSFRKFVSWHEFIIDLSARFRDDKGHNVVEQFKKLEQKGSLEDYIDEFEDLRSVLVQNNHYLPDSYILDCFIGGLKASIRLYVKAFKPNCLAQAIEYARLREESLEVEHARYTKFQKPPPYNSSKPPLLPTPQTKAANFPPNKGFKYIPADVRAEKIAKGLCYYCDKPFEKGHKCSFREQLFTVEIPAEVDLTEAWEEEVDQLDSIIATEGNDACLFVQALTGGHSYQTMRLKPFRGTLPTAVHIPEWFQGQVVGTHPRPAAIIDRRIQKVQNKAQVQYLVQWEGYSNLEATWEPAEDFKAAYPDFQT